MRTRRFVALISAAMAACSSEPARQGLGLETSRSEATWVLGQVTRRSIVNEGLELLTVTRNHSRLKDEIWLWNQLFKEGVESFPTFGVDRDGPDSFRSLDLTDVTWRSVIVDYCGPARAMGHVDVEAYTDDVHGLGSSLTLWILAARGPLHPRLGPREHSDPRWGLTALVLTPRSSFGKWSSALESIEEPRATGGDAKELERLFLDYLRRLATDSPGAGASLLAEHAVLRDPRTLRVAIPQLDDEVKRYLDKDDVNLESWSLLAASDEVALGNGTVWLGAALSEMAVIFRREPSKSGPWRIEMIVPTSWVAFG